jgi:multicomponent Na+:H+ antiporter subunit F
MSELTTIFVQVALVVLSVLLLPCVYRVLVGPSPSDRLQAVETITTLLIGIVILLMLVQESAFVLDVGIALAAFSFIGTLGIARYLAEGRVF